MRIGIDVDDTITNAKEKQAFFWKDYVKKYENDKYDENLPKAINYFDVDTYIDNFWNIYRNEISFEASVKDDVSDIMRKLRRDGYEICIVTSRPDERYDNLKEKMTKWFQDQDIEMDHLYTNVRNKGQFIADNDIDLLIDDDYRHCEKAISLGKRAICFGKEERDIPSIDNWKEIYDYIKDNFKDID